MKERWLVTLYVKFITLHKSNIRHYERKYSLMFQKLYSVSLITKQANCKTCYWRWLEWNFLCISQIWKYHFLLIGTTVLFNAQLWRKLFLQQLIFRSKNLTQKLISYRRSPLSTSTLILLFLLMFTFLLLSWRWSFYQTFRKQKDV